MGSLVPHTCSKSNQILSNILDYDMADKLTYFAFKYKLQSSLFTVMLFALQGFMKLLPVN